MIFTLVCIKLRLPSAYGALAAPGALLSCLGVAEVVSIGFPAPMAGLIYYLVAISQQAIARHQPAQLALLQGRLTGRKGKDQQGLV